MKNSKTAVTDKFVLKKDHLIPLLRRFNKEYRLVAPRRTRQGDTLFTEVRWLDTFHLDLENQAQSSAKAFFLPQDEVLFRYERRAGNDYIFTPTGTSRPTIYFGLRSCDLSAILYMDVIFQRAKDPYYLSRRQDAILINLSCTTPFENCFCNATKTGPFLEYGFDLQLTDLGDRFFVEVSRAKGRELVTRWPVFFSPTTEEDAKAQYQVFLEARGMFRRSVPVEQAVKLLGERPVPDRIWKALSSRCQDCGGCAYMCPTCTCFTIHDRHVGQGRGERIRSWDACTFSGFTLMAGGHNPVDKRRHAVRKRFLHKLKHDVEKHGRTSCMGCGRCVSMCFGGVDIVRFVDMVCQEA